MYPNKQINNHNSINRDKQILLTTLAIQFEWFSGFLKFCFILLIATLCFLH